MNFSLVINGTDRADSVEARSFRWTTQSRGKPDQIACTIESASENFGIDIAQEVIFSIDSVKKFHGQVVDCTPVRIGEDRRGWNLLIQDHTEEARQGSLIAEIYKNQTVKQILDDIFSRYPHLSNFSTAGVNCDIEIDYVFFGYKKTHDCIKDLADRVGYDFYFDENRVLQFFLPGEISAPFSATDTNQKIIKKSLKFQKKLSGIANSILLEGADYTANQQKREPDITANGTDTEFSIISEYAGLEVQVDSVIQSVGSFGLHDAADFDCLYDLTSRKIIFRDDNKPTSGQIIKISGYEKLPIFIQKTEASSISKYGERPKTIKNTAIKTIDSARQFASAEISRYASEQYSGGFSTYDTGLRSGQRITVSDSFLEISEEFSVAKTVTQIIGENTFISKISLSNAEIIDTAGLLARMINTENTSSSTSDILKIYREVLEKVGITEEVGINQAQITLEERVHLVESTQVTENATLEYVHSPYTQQGFADTKRVFLHDSSPHA